VETNQLADSLGHWVEAARPYTNAILAAILIVVGSIGVYVVAQRRTAASNAQAWEEYFVAFSQHRRIKLEDLGEAYAGTPVGAWSLCMAADMALEEGSEELFRDKALARDILRKSVDQYQQVIGETQEDTLLKQAWFGLARAHECLGELKQAEEEYGRLVAKWPGTPLATAAEARSKDLQRHETKEFYDWFAKQDIRKRVQSGPGTPGFRAPFDFGTLPGSSGDTGGSPASPSDDGASPSSSEAPDSDTSGAATRDAVTRDAATPDAATPDAGTPGTAKPDAAAAPAGAVPDAAAANSTAAPAATGGNKPAGGKKETGGK
jgi:hypothetical protein